KPTFLSAVANALQARCAWNSPNSVSPLEQNRTFPYRGFPRAARTYIAIAELVTVAQKELLTVTTCRRDPKIAIPESGDHSSLNMQPSGCVRPVRCRVRSLTKFFNSLR